MFKQDKSSQQLIKEQNLKLVFRLIHQHGSISRADLKKITGLSATTVSSLIEELILDGIVVERGIKDSTTSGRKAVLLSIRPGGGRFISLDVQDEIVVIDSYLLDFSLAFHAEIPMNSVETLVGDVVSAIRNASGEKLLGISIASAYVDYASFTPTNEVMEKLDRIYQAVSLTYPDVNLQLMHDAGYMAYAEMAVHSEMTNLLLVNIHDGISAGIILNGKLYKGGTATGRIGHMSVDMNGESCWCGSRGCLEKYTSTQKILEKADCKTISALQDKLEQGDANAIQVVTTAAKALAFVLANISNTIGLETVIIGGKVKELGEFFIDKVIEEFRVIAIARKCTDISYSEIEGNTVTLGGAKSSFDEYFGL